MDGLDDIVEEFLVESHENLDQLDSDLVALEQDPNSRERLSSIFRTIHTIKGTSGFLAFNRLEEVTHVGENMLSRLRDGELELTPTRTSVLLQMVDTVRALLTSIEASGGEGPVDVSGRRRGHHRRHGGRPRAARPGAAPGRRPRRVRRDGRRPQKAPPRKAAAPPRSRRPQATAAKKPAAAQGRHARERRRPAAAAPAPCAAAETAVAGRPVVESPAAVLPSRVAPSSPSTAGVEALTPSTGDGDAAPVDQQRPGPPRGRRQHHPRGRRPARRADAARRRAGAHPQPDRAERRPADRHRPDPRLAAAQPDRQRAAGGRHEDAHAAHRPHLVQAAARRPRPRACSCKKSIRLEMEGRETELDKTLLEAVKDPLTHLVRNSVDHGIEAPDVRKAAGKPAEGVLTLRARHESGQVVVEVADDGAGIDPAKLGAQGRRARPGHRRRSSTRMSPADILQLIFLPGFSTAAAVTNVSGRGVGMDVVKTNIEAIGGTIEVESEAGRGTVCRLRIPLTLAIVPALTVECAGDRYAIPQISLQELVSLDAEKAANAVEEVGGAPVYRLRGELLPLVRLDRRPRAWPPSGTTATSSSPCCSSEGRRFGLVVDRVINTEEIVVKAGRRPAQGDRPVLRRDRPRRRHRRADPRRPGAGPPGAARRDRRAPGRRDGRGAAAAAVPRPSGSGCCWPRIGGGRRVAIPLDTVTRLEQVRADSVEKVGNREVVQYRGAILPIVRLDRHLGAYGETDREVLEVIVYADHGRSVAIVVEEILDIVDGEAAVPQRHRRPGPARLRRPRRQGHRAARRPGRDPGRRPGVLLDPPRPDPRLRRPTS